MKKSENFISRLRQRPLLWNILLIAAIILAMAVAAHVLKRSSPSSRRCRTNLTLRPERPALASSA